MFTQVSKTVVSDTLNGTRLTKQKLNREGGTYLSKEGLRAGTTSVGHPRYKTA